MSHASRMVSHSYLRDVQRQVLRALHQIDEPLGHFIWTHYLGKQHCTQQKASHTHKGGLSH